MAAWLRELIRAGHLPKGEVDEGSIEEVRPADLRGFGQCHFFAGIGGWVRALRLGRRGAEPSVWTGSCPCGPWSIAGRRRGTADSRDLWPIWLALIDECRPATLFGEQVAGRAGRAWLSRLQTDLERVGYGVAGADLCAAGVGAPHIRPRLYWLAHSERQGRQGGQPAKLRGARRRPEGGEPFQLGSVPGPWTRLSLIKVGGKVRVIEPGIDPLAHAVPGRMVMLRGYGNAIVPELGAAFVRAAFEAIGEGRGEHV